MDYLEHKLGGGKIPNQKQFLENDRKVLKFFVHSEVIFINFNFSIQVPFVLHYYLADDSIEIKELNFENR